MVLNTIIILQWIWWFNSKSVFCLFFPKSFLSKISTRYTVRGRGAKRRTSSALPTTYLTRFWSKTTCLRLATYARSRHIAENFQNVQYQAWSGGYLSLLTSCKKSSKRVQKTGPWTGWYQVLTFLRAVHFWILQNSSCKPPVDSSREAAFCSPS